MHLIINEDSKIVATANYAVDESECAKRKETVIYIDDSLYKTDMVGCLYIDSEPYYVKPPSKFHQIIKGQHVLTDEGTRKCWAHVRQTRNHLLSLTDWTQLGDVKLTDDEKNRFNSLRTRLRDITQIQDALAALAALKNFTFEIVGKPTP